MRKTLIGLATLFMSAAEASLLHVMNPTELKEQMGEDGEVESKLSNIGFSNLQKDTSRIG